MRAAVQITQAVESFDVQSQASQKPDNQHAVGVVMTDMFEEVAGSWLRCSLGFRSPSGS
jgi:hypothetical protein